MSNYKLVRKVEGTKVHVSQTKKALDNYKDDDDLTGKIAKYKSMPVKVLRKLTEEEKQERSHLNNPDAGNYYEVETTTISKALPGTDKFIVWEARLSDIREEGSNFYGADYGSEEADDILFALQAHYGLPKYDYDDFNKMNLTQEEVNEAIEYAERDELNKFTYFEKKQKTQDSLRDVALITKEQILSQLAKHFKDRFDVFIYGNNVEISSDTVASPELFDVIHRKNIFGKRSNDYMSAPHDEDFVLLKLDKMNVDSTKDALKDELSLVETIGDYTIKKNNDDFLKFAVFYKGQIIAETTTVAIAKRQIKEHQNDSTKDSFADDKHKNSWMSEEYEEELEAEYEDDEHENSWMSKEFDFHKQ